MNTCNKKMEVGNFIKELKKHLNEKPNVICIGPYNRGKSSLLNALINDYSNKTFAVADKRTTIKNQNYEFEGIVYTDTPGLNATKEDDKTTLLSVSNSDVNIFVHSLEDGELDSQELKYLETLADELNTKKMLFDKTIFVINHIESFSKNEIEEAKKRIFSQIKDKFDMNPIIMIAKTPSYIKGIKDNKEMLIKNSGINELKDLIKDMTLPEIIIKNRQIRISRAVDSLVIELQNIVKENENKLEQIRLKEDEIKSKIHQINETILSMSKRAIL